MKLALKQRCSTQFKHCSLLFFITFLLLASTSANPLPSVWDVLRNQLRLDHEISQPEVQQQIRWLIAHPGYLDQLAHSERYMYHIITEIQKRHLPGEIALIPMIESSYDPFAYSSAGAAGLWQLMPGTGTGLGLKRDWWYDARRSIGASTNAALNYLSYLQNYFNGNWTLAIAAYDSGEGTVTNAVKKLNLPLTQIKFWNLQLPQETKIYVPRLLALAELIKYPQHYHLTLPDIPHTPYFEEVNIGSQIDLNQAAKLAGITYRELLKLNPGFNRWATAPYAPFKILIPTEKVGEFYRQLAQIPKEKRVSWTHYEVKNGDNLQTIAQHYFTTIKLLRELNQLPSDQVKQGQRLVIPSSRYVAIRHILPPGRNLLPIPQKTTLAAYKVLHIVQTNDTLHSIAQKYHVTEDAIKQWNPNVAKTSLQKNQQLIVWRNNPTNSDKMNG